MGRVASGTNGGDFKKKCVVMDDNNMVEWLNLPQELWLDIISKKLNTFDILRFRSVCTLWRSILPPPFPSPSHTLRIRDGWIIKVEKSKSGKFRHIDVLTNTLISHTFSSNVDGGEFNTFEPLDDVYRVVLFSDEGLGQMVDEESSRWVRVTDLGDVLFVLTKDLIFSLSANDYYGFEGNCIYSSSDGRTARFNLNNSEVEFVDNIFWPCPTLFSSDSVSFISKEY
ncbi:hypothetical protein TSUD_143710 [Trifolium subterraneum]|uniref:F-box domain-containing protein n=1 Tax=Trifolium subterraneum TaxID=3900 RepID=A0A2Z6MMM8_TRISU|nr:hypothetical protein TSUD_143710 [Trifolium subterraneum]